MGHGPVMGPYISAHACTQGSHPKLGHGCPYGRQGSLQACIVTNVDVLHRHMGRARVSW